MQGDFDHYGATAEELVRITGGYRSIRDSDFHDFLPPLQRENYEIPDNGMFTAVYCSASP